MTSSVLTRAAPALLLSAALTAGFAAPGFAQSNTATNPSANTPAQTTGTTMQNANNATEAAPANGEAAPSLEQMAEERLQQLHERLNITQKEQPKWDKFADTMRSNAQSLDKAYQQRADKIDQMNAVENMQSYAHIERMRANDMNKLVGPFKTLYAALSPQQQQEANALFRQRAQAAAERHQATTAQSTSQPGH